MKHIPILLVTEKKRLIKSIVASFDSMAVDVLESEPTYASYLKVLQYLPAIVVIELPKTFHDQLHFLQMLKQNSSAAVIPVIGFGAHLQEKVLGGLKKIGLAEYVEEPVDVKKIDTVMLNWLHTAGFVVRKKEEGAAEAVSADTGKLLAIDTPREEKIEIMVRHVNEMMAFPFTLTVAMKLAQQPDCTIAELARTIEADPVISAQFLKRANSAFFAGAHTRISSIKDAIVRIGLNETRRMISGMAVMQLFDTQAASHGFNRLEFWKHCLGVAIVAEQLALLGGKVDPNEAFLAGILHDFGIIIMDEYFPTLFGKVLQYATDQGVSFYDAEQQLLLVDHTEVVSRLFSVWKLPEHITNAVVYHYQAVETKSSTEGVVAADAISIITGLANIVAKSYRLGMPCDMYITMPADLFFEAAGIHGRLPSVFKETVLKKFKAYNDFISADTDNNLQKRNAAAIVLRRCLGVIELGSTVFNPVRENLLQQEYQIVNLMDSGSNTLPPYDMVILFTNGDCDVEQLYLKYQHLAVKGNSDSQHTMIPVVFIVNGNMSQQSVKNIPQVSYLSSSLDLRLLSAYIENILSGNVLQILPHIKKAEAVTAKKGKGNDAAVQEAFSVMQKYREKCLTEGIENEFSREAARYLKQAQTLTREKLLNPEGICSLIELSLQLYRKAWLVYELHDCNLKIEQGMKT